MTHVLASATSLSWWWLWHPLYGPGYQLYSGIVGDISQVTVLGALGAFYWHHTCHVHGCWRFAKHPVDGTPFRACRRHHPAILDAPVTAERIAQAHENARRKPDDLAGERERDGRHQRPP